MKLFGFLAAAAVVVTAAAPTVSLAQGRVVERHTTVSHHGRAHVKARTVCRTVWRHGHRDRVCRTVR